MDALMANNRAMRRWLATRSKGPSEEEVLNACYQYNNGKLIIQPDFKACLNRAEQVDYVYKGKVYWKAGTPLPNPHRPELNSHYSVTSIDRLCSVWSEMRNFDGSVWDLSQVESAWLGFHNCYLLKSWQLNWNGNNVIEDIRGFIHFNQLTSLDFSTVSFINCTVDKMEGAFKGLKKVTEAYARTQADCDKLNASEGKPTTWKFVVKQQ